MNALLASILYKLNQIVNLVNLMLLYLFVMEEIKLKYLKGIGDMIKI